MIRAGGPDDGFLSTLPARGATCWLPRFVWVSGVFLSTLPARGATGGDAEGDRPKVISIHAPREGSDGYPALMSENCIHFYPRSPRGERQQQSETGRRLADFYPRSPRGERRLPADPQ